MHVIYVCDNVRISKYKNILKKDTLLVYLKIFFWLKNVSILFRGHM